MKTAVLFLLAIIGLAPLVMAETTDPGEARQSADLKQLLADVQKNLPKGWRAEITPDIPKDLIDRVDYRYEKCCLLIWHEEKVLGRLVGQANPPVGVEDEERAELEFKLTVPTIQLAVVKYLSPEAYDKAHDDNIQRQQQRLAFEQKFHRTMKWGYMGPRPIPPDSYDPSTDVEKELIRQYTLLWTQTNLEPLPTHYYKTLSFDADLNEHQELKDEKLNAQQNHIRESLSKIISAYQAKPLPIDP